MQWSVLVRYFLILGVVGLCNLFYDSAEYLTGCSQYLIGLMCWRLKWAVYNQISLNQATQDAWINWITIYEVGVVLGLGGLLMGWVVGAWVRWLGYSCWSYISRSHREPPQITPTVRRWLVWRWLLFTPAELDPGSAMARGVYQGVGVGVGGGLAIYLAGSSFVISAAIVLAVTCVGVYFSVI